VPQKITITGIPKTPLRIVKAMMSKEKNAPKVYSFDIKESGTTVTPKYLPKGSTILFTVFINEKQLRNAGLDEETFKDNKIMVQGEIVLDLSMNLCPGEMGVTAFQLQVLQPKEKQQENDNNGKATEGV